MSSSIDDLNVIKKMVDSACEKMNKSNLIKENINVSTPMIKIVVGSVEFSIVDEQPMIKTVLLYISSELKKDAESIISRIDYDKKR